MRKNVYCLRVKYELFSSECYKTWIFSTNFRKNTQMSSFMKIFLMGAEFLHVDGRTAIRKKLVDAPVNSLLTSFTS